MYNRIKDLESCNDIDKLKQEIKFLRWAFNRLAEENKELKEKSKLMTN